MENNDKLDDQRKFMEETIELIVKYGKWTCNDHITCHTCEYFNNPCDGSWNSTDPQVEKRKKMRYQVDMERRSQLIRDEKIKWLERGDFFDYLSKEEFTNIVNPVYNALRILEHLPVESTVKWRIEHSENSDILDHIIDDILRIEYVEIHQLQREIADAYIVRLSQILQSVSMKGVTHDVDVDKVLEELRKIDPFKR